MGKEKAFLVLTPSSPKREQGRDEYVGHDWLPLARFGHRPDSHTTIASIYHSLRCNDYQCGSPHAHHETPTSWPLHLCLISMMTTRNCKVETPSRLATSCCDCHVSNNFKMPMTRIACLRKTNAPLLFHTSHEHTGVNVWSRL